MVVSVTIVAHIDKTFLCIFDRNIMYMNLALARDYRISAIYLWDSALFSFWGPSAVDLCLVSVAIAGDDVGCAVGLVIMDCFWYFPSHVERFPLYGTLQLVCAWTQLHPVFLAPVVLLSTNAKGGGPGSSISWFLAVDRRWKIMFFNRPDSLPLKTACKSPARRDRFRLKDTGNLIKFIRRRSR